MHDQRHRISQRFQPVQIAGIGNHGIGQCTPLGPLCLVGLVEIGAYCRIALEHQRIEYFGDAIDVLGDGGQGGVDDVAGCLGKHAVPPHGLASCT